MIKVLFVCLGNICRSPMAEAVFKHLVQKKGLEARIKVDSAGTGDWHLGHEPHQGTQTILKKNKINFDGIKARLVSEDDLMEFDYIIGMDAENVGNLRAMAGYQKVGYIGRLLDFVPNSNMADVPDPYFSGDFDEVFRLVKTGCMGLLDTIQKEYTI